MADWSRLAKELLELIAGRLDTCFDLVHFRSVCSSWRSFVPPSSRTLYVRDPLPPCHTGSSNYYLEKLPIFLFRFPQSQNQSSTTRCFLVKVREDEDGRMKLECPLYAKDRQRLESPRALPSGCSILLDSLNCHIIPLGHEYVCNLRFQRGSLEGPRLIQTWRQTAFMPLDTEDGDFAVAGSFFSRNLMMFRSIDKQWRLLTSTTGEKLEDIASFNGKFYIVDDTERTMVVEPSLDESFFSSTGTRAERKKLILSGDELLLVEIFSPTRDLDDPRERMIWCRVFKLDERMQKWDRVEHLGDRVLFLGKHCKFSCSSRDLPGVKGNCIFFYDSNYRGRPEDILVFNLRDGSVKHVGNIPGYLDIFRPPPELITPSV